MSIADLIADTEEKQVLMKLSRKQAEKELVYPIIHQDGEILALTLRNYLKNAKLYFKDDSEELKELEELSFTVSNLAFYYQVPLY